MLYLYLVLAVFIEEESRVNHLPDVPKAAGSFALQVIVLILHNDGFFHDALFAGRSGEDDIEGQFVVRQLLEVPQRQHNIGLSALVVHCKGICDFIEAVPCIVVESAEFAVDIAFAGYQYDKRREGGAEEKFAHMEEFIYKNTKLRLEVRTFAGQ